MEGEWLDSSEVAAILGCLNKRVCTLARHGRLKGEMVTKTDGIRGGRSTQWRFSRAAVDEYVASGNHCMRSVRAVSITATQEDIIWFAGFFDGEGCVMMQRRPPRCHGWTLAIILGNTALAVVASLPALFGGECTPVRVSSDHKLPQLRWRAHSRQAALVLAAILPYLRVKRRQAEIAIEFQRRMDAGNYNSHRPIPAEEIAWRDEAGAKMRWLNHHYE